MKSTDLILASLVAAALATGGGPAAWAAAGAQAVKRAPTPRPKGVPSPVPAADASPVPVVAAGGLRLKLALAMRDPVGPPRYRARDVRALYAPPTYVPPTYTPPTYTPPTYAPQPYAPPAPPYLPRGGENPYLPKSAARVTAPDGGGAPRPAAPVPTIVAAPSAPPAPGAFTAPAPSAAGTGVLGALGHALPILPDSGRDILPTIKKVYPTGEKPLVVVSFKCPTELVGVTPPTIKLLHDAVSLGMDGLNKSNLLSFNLQQVCQ